MGRPRRRRAPKRLHARGRRAFFHPHAVIERQVAKVLHQSARPTDRSGYRSFCATQTEKQFLAVLGEEPGSGLHQQCLATRFRCHRNRRSNGVAIAFLAGEAKRDGRPELRHDVLQKPQCGVRCGSSKTLPPGHHDRSRRAQTIGRPRRSPSPPPRIRRKMSRPDCSCRKCCARNRSRCRRSE
jgi:hypothetical protein